MFVHAVHFWLKPDLTDAQRADFIAGVRKLADSPNVATVRVGLPAGTPRDVVDNSYDVQLICHFESSDAHDRYQSADDAAHQTFIDTYKPMMAKVVIYDSIDA